MNRFLLIGAFILLSGVLAKAQEHSSLSVPSSVVKAVQTGTNVPPIFQQTLNATQLAVKYWMDDGILVPVPKDMAGGYTHEVHKRNLLLMQQAGSLYQLTEDKQYFTFLRELFLTYAEKYPTFGAHPSTKSYAPGKLFWQALNDANWLVYGSQAYASIRPTLSVEDRGTIENDFLRPYADYISLESPQFFNRVHNHSTWGNAGVGMLAIALDDDGLLQRALYGLPASITTKLKLDNDGGDIKASPNGDAGFYAQLDNAFSPDGYYSEGPYYQRYAMLPFIVFAQALETHDPSLKIFEYRDGLLQKAVHALVGMTDESGVFYPINDAQKGMSILSRELIAAVDVVYFYCGREQTLLTTAQKQGKVQLDQTGFAIAKALNELEVSPPQLKSQQWSDGRDGKGGGIATLRGVPHPNGRINALFKFGTQGMGHGHFDRLSYQLFAGDTEILQDYGAARWVNIDQKGGGRYLPENQTWAKQTIAHNTVVLDRKSQFNGSTKRGEAHPSESYFFNLDEGNYTAVSAKDRNAYPGTELHRTVALLHEKLSGQPLWLDIFRVNSSESHSADLPFHFASQLMTSSAELTTELDNLQALGKDAGYQHAFLEAAGQIDSSHYKVSWYNEGKFFTQVSTADAGDSIVFARIGANDPQFNLRRDAFHVLSKSAAKEHLFVSVISAHGKYDPVSEICKKPYAELIQPQVLIDNAKYTAVTVTVADKASWTIIIANQNNSSKQQHTLDVSGQPYTWTGPLLIKRKNL
ncbi:MAG: heparinase II/III family protein [Saprospiraceae bacterium]